MVHVFSLISMIVPPLIQQTLPIFSTCPKIYLGLECIPFDFYFFD